MFREKEICNAIRTAYLYLFPDKKERKRALSRLNMELVAQSVRYRGESVLAYQTAGNHECSLNYYGPELFPQRGFCMSDVELTPVEWLWKPYLPFEKLSVLQGNPGEGKTYFAMHLAAACTNGKLLPNMEHMKPFNVIDRKSTRLNSSHLARSRMPSSA